MLRRTVPTAESAQMPSSDASQHFSVNASQHPTHSGGLQGVGALWGGDRRELSPEPSLCPPHPSLDGRMRGAGRGGGVTRLMSVEENLDRLPLSALASDPHPAKEKCHPPPRKKRAGYHRSHSDVAEPSKCQSEFDFSNKRSQKKPHLPNTQAFPPPFSSLTRNYWNSYQSSKRNGICRRRDADEGGNQGVGGWLSRKCPKWGGRGRARGKRKG